MGKDMITFDHDYNGRDGDRSFRMFRVECDEHHRLLRVFKLFKSNHRVSFSSSLPVGVVSIVNKHLENGWDLLMCQDELIDAGYAKYARF